MSFGWGTMQVLEQVAATYAWYQGYGNRIEAGALATYVTNPEHRDVWVANHVSGVRAATFEDIERVLADAERAFAECDHRMVVVDSFTPDAFVARLALDGYTELAPTIQMVLDSPLRAEPAPVQIRPVEREHDWEALLQLVRADHDEGKKTRGLALSESVTQGMVAGYRAKAAVCQFFIATLEGIDCAYGCRVVGPHGMGIVEDLFTLPKYRKRGLATALIAHVVRSARHAGMGPMLIGALADQPPKRMYAKLGFVPRCLTRSYLRQSGAVGP